MMQSSKANSSSLNPRKFDEKIALLQASETESNEKFNRLLDELKVLKNRLSTGDPARRTVSTPNVAGGSVRSSAGGSPAPTLPDCSSVPFAAAATCAGAAPAVASGLSSSSSNIAAANALTLSPQHGYSNNSPVSSPTHGTGYALSPTAAQHQPLHQQHSSSTKHRVREYIISKTRDHRVHPYSPTHQRSRDEYDPDHSGFNFGVGAGGSGVGSAGAGSLGPPLGPRRASSDTNIVEKLQQQQGFADFYYNAIGSSGLTAASTDFSACQQFNIQPAQPPPPPSLTVPMSSPLLHQQLLLLQQQQQQQQQQPVMLQSDMTRLSLATPPLQHQQQLTGSPVNHHQQQQQQQSLVAALLAPTGGSGVTNRSSWHHYQMTQSDEDLSSIGGGGLGESALPAASIVQQPAPLVLPQSPTGPIPDIRVTPISQAAAMPPPPPPPPMQQQQQQQQQQQIYPSSDLAAATAAQHLDNGCGVRRDSYTMATEVLASLATAAPSGFDGRFNGEQQTDGFTF